MNPQLLLSFFIICSVLSTVTQSKQSSFDRKKNSPRLLSQNIIDQEAKKVQKAIKQKSSFQKFHFSLEPNKKFIEFFVDPMLEQQIEGHISVLWKHKNAFLLPDILTSQKLKLEIYQRGQKIYRKSFYTRVAFRFYAESDKLYRIKISHKKKSLLTKLVTFYIEHFFEQFQQPSNAQKYSMINEIQETYQSKQFDSEDSQKNIIYLDDQKKKKVNRKVQSQYSKKSEKFQLWEVSQRMKYFLRDIKLLINEAETKHLAEYTVEKFIFDSIQIYWQYEVFECVIVILCSFIEVFMVNKLFTDNKILV